VTVLLLADTPPNSLGDRFLEAVADSGSDALPPEDGRRRADELVAGGAEADLRDVRGGALGYAEQERDGAMTFMPLRRVRTHRRADKGGTFRWYNDYELPAHLAGGVITVRLHGTVEDTKRKLNRPENLRPIPPGDPDFKKLCPLRVDAESINRGLEDSLYLRRAHSVGRARQHLNLIGWALTVNSLTRAEHRARPPGTVAA
jgi:hypothetical protein